MTSEEIRKKWPNDIAAEQAAQIAEMRELLALHLPGLALDIHALIVDRFTKRDAGTRYSRPKGPFVIKNEK